MGIPAAGRRRPVKTAQSNPHVEAEGGSEMVGDEDILRGSLGKDLAVEKDDVGGMMTDRAEVVADHKLGESALAPKALEQFAEQMFAADIDTRRGFVENEELGLVLEGGGEEDALEFASGQRAKAPGGEGIRMYGSEKIEGGISQTLRGAEPERSPLVAHHHKVHDGDGRAPVEVYALGNIAEAWRGGGDMDFALVWDLV
jgi:hypothetical protein